MELTTELLLQFKPRTQLKLLSRGRFIVVDIDKLHRVKRSGQYVFLYTESGQITVQSSLSSILRELPVNEFFKISKSHIVSLHRITRIGRRRVSIGEHSFPFTDYYRERMRKRLGQLAEQHLRILLLPRYSPQKTAI